MLIRAFRWTVAAAVASLVMLPAAAAAADDLIVIPVSGFARGDEGDVITIATVDVPAETVGATCQITGRTVNQVSVHPGNDLLIITNGQTFVVPDFEDAGFIEHEAGEIASVGSTIQLQIRFGPDGLSSGGFRVTVECDPDNFTTTTVAEPPTTTEGPTEPSTTDTTATEEPPAGPTTESPATTEPSTTAAPTTAAPTTAGPTTESPDTSVAANPPTTAEEPPAGPTTEAPATTSTTAAPTTAAPTTEEPPAGPEADDDAALPVTGSSTGLILSFGAVFVAAGVVLRRFAAQQPSTS